MTEKLSEYTGAISKFDGSNYHQWKFQIKCALKAKGVYDIASGTTRKPVNTGEGLENWEKKDAIAMFTLTAAMDLNQITLVQNCDSSEDIIKKLDSIYQQNSETNKLLVHERFHQYKMNPNESIAQHIAKVESLAKQIRETGEMLSDTTIITKILSTLPQKYRNVRQAWLSVDERKQTITNLTSRLLDEETNLTSQEEMESALAAMSIKKSEEGLPQCIRKSPSVIVCYNCGKRGHIARNCRIPNKRYKSRAETTAFATSNGDSALENDHEEHEIVLNVSTSDDSRNDHWIMDSGASAHMTYRKDFFYKLDETYSSVVTLGNNLTLSVKGRGTVKIQKYAGEHWSNATINDVLYIPELRKNLFSEGVVTRKGMKIIKDGKGARIYEEGDLVACGVREENNLYRMLFRPLSYNVNVTIKR